jgi:hypothetical protein
MDRWIARKIKAIEYKGGKSSNAITVESIQPLEFHHRNPNTKDFDWTELRLHSWARIIQELDKCDLVCKNCHAEIHYPHAVF